MVPGSSLSEFQGRLVPNTQCDYKLDRCSQRTCVLRSPHYPGLYPRNISCTYHIFVLPGEVPQGKQVLVLFTVLVWLDVAVIRGLHYSLLS